MKKLLKKFSVVLVAAMMLITMCIPVLAADGGATNSLTVTNNGKTEHTFELYQIFKGDLSDGVLSNITWGSGITTAAQTALGDAATKASTLKAEADVKTFADTLVEKKYLATATATQTAAANANAVFANLDAGYYLVMDKASSQTGEQAAYTAYIMQVVGNVTASTKLDVPTVEKKVKEKNDTTANESDWQDAADYDIGDDVPYQLTGTLPANFAEYETYTTYTFTDTLPAGLTYNNDAAVKIGDKVITSRFDIKSEGNKLTISLNSGEDMKKIATSAADKIVVTYTAKLNKNAAVGKDGNRNTVDLTYSNNPNKGGNGDFGKTPEDKVTVFTYTIEANKVKEDGKTPLEGAGFTLYKIVNGTETKVGDEIKGVTSFTFKGVDAGKYVLKETTVPSGYNKAADITFTVKATYDTTSDDPQLKELTVSNATASFTATSADGKVSTTVVNTPGSNLPSTGGIGTTIFYVAGMILVAGAAAALVLKRRKRA